MELVKNIFFNTDKLTQDSTIKISYIGELYHADCKKVFLHYGFDSDWKNVQDIEMEKTELGYQAAVDLGQFDTFNFCFKTDNDLWDNNNGLNYIFDIEKPETSLAVIDEKLLSIKYFKRAYIWSKKIRQAVYKMIQAIPEILSGNYKRTKNQEGKNT